MKGNEPFWRDKYCVILLKYHNVGAGGVDTIASSGGFVSPEEFTDKTSSKRLQQCINRSKMR